MVYRKVSSDDYRKCYEMWLDGYSYDLIAKKFGITSAGARRRVQAYVKYLDRRYNYPDIYEACKELEYTNPDWYISKLRRCLEEAGYNMDSWYLANVDEVSEKSESFGEKSRAVLKLAQDLFDERN